MIKCVGGFKFSSQLFQNKKDDSPYKGIHKADSYAVLDNAGLFAIWHNTVDNKLYISQNAGIIMTFEACCIYDNERVCEFRVI